MIGIDTNILVRYLAQDDPAQSALATRLIEQRLNEREPGYLTVVTLVEAGWVMKRLYRASDAEWRDTVRELLDVRQFVVEHRECVVAALSRLGERAGDLADALITEAATAAGCTETLTFDRAATRLGMSLLK